MKRLLGGLAMGIAAQSAAAIDVASMWDFARPEVSEQRFRDALAGASRDDAAILRTQIARTHGLRRDFAKAREVLAAMEPDLPALGAEARARHALEWGRTLVSAAHRDGEVDDAARAAARAAYLKAHDIAAANRLDALAVDALHMIPFVETDAEQALRGNQRALQAALASDQPAAQRWEVSLRSNIGVELQKLGRREEALAMFRAAADALDRLGGSPMRKRIEQWRIAWSLRLLGRVDEALAIQQRLERENDEAKTPDHYVFDELMHLHRARGDDAQARHYEDLARRTPP